ncbi:uncharacterized protein N7482_009701 [Penicillium canariense]|uniref:Carrier domain-containing protein n=1 Tax=Penicillium canariense TaxID=189055 RepID=A0A9W9HQL7_9EURO|nr:uncharacterized protein N7482_009701 [Penicillium canariense]KAJ5153223.1 hypothetical protein N7482_009701 [Penicillium canariense]
MVSLDPDPRSGQEQICLKAESDDSPVVKSSQYASDVKEISRHILDIFLECALNKFEYTENHLDSSGDDFLSLIGRFVAQGARVQACLPAFPFKSANKVYKVLGSLPDKAEELALDRLNTLCMRIQDIYSPGAEIVVISDGIVYNDLLCISDQETWHYGEALRKMASEQGFDNISFSRIRDLLNFPVPEELTEIVYVANCTNFRRLLLNRYGKAKLDIDHEIATNPDTKLTYLGYKRFLESDLQYIFPRGEHRSAHSYKRDCKYLAKQMLTRGYAFAGAVKDAFSNHLRLSIHESISGTKIPISLLNTRTGFTTPWHCAVAQLADGSWVSAPMGEFSQDSRLEVVHVDGTPNYYREKISDAGHVAICEKTARYLQSAKYINATAYVNGAFQAALSLTSSPSEASLSSSGIKSPDSTFTTPEAQLTPQLSPSQSGLGITFPLKPYIASTQSEAETTVSEAYGRRLIPQIMDSLAASEPERVVFPLHHSRMGSFSLTPFLLDNSPEQSTRPPDDLRHVILTYACVKAGYAALFLSPKNNTDGILAVLTATDCNIWVDPVDTSPVPVVKDVLQKRPMKSLQLPMLHELLDAESTEAFPYTKSFDDAINDPFCYLHTSGSTGLPKPIPWSHGLIGTMDAVRLLPPVGENADLVPWTSDWNEGDMIYSSFPMSHGAGIIMDILMPALFNLHCVLGPVGVLPNLNLVERLAVDVRPDIWSMVPSLVDELGETPEILEKLRPSKFICASGGPVSPVSSGKVNEVVRVLNLTGTTEGLFIGNLKPEREDWFWFCFHPFSGFEFKELETDTYEHWVHRNEHWPLFQGIFHTFPDKDSINFKDLYMRHPTKQNLWAFKGRSDDLVVLSNGYKISPLETEAFITTHPAVRGCLIFGTGKPQAGLLIELNDPFKKSADLIDSIWKTVQRANSMSQHKNQLLKDFVTFALPDKPFLRTDKGTVKRATTLALYSEYFERFYSSRNDDSDQAISLDLSSTKATEDSIRTIISSFLSDNQDVLADTDFFTFGLDSLGVFAAVKAIRAASGLGDKIAPRHVYAHPTIASLAATVSTLIEEAKSANDENPLDKVLDDDASTVKDMIAQHKARQSFRLNAFDYVNPNHGMGIMLYFSIHEEISFEQWQDDALLRARNWLQKGDLCVTIPPLSMAASARNRLLYKDLSHILQPFEKLKEAGFPPSAFPDGLVLRDDPFPKFPADIFSGQVNFFSGGCVIAVDFNHCCLDGLGVMVVLKAWAENCRYLQGDQTATCTWYDSESFNHALPEIIHEHEGWARPVEEIDPGTWGFLPFFPPVSVTSNNHTLPAAPDFKLHNIWPLPRAERCPKTTMFLIKPEQLEKMKQDVVSDPESKGIIKSISDIVQAFLWRASIRVRHRVATEIRKETFKPDEVSILELPTDGRPYFSALLPETYMGSLLILNRSTMPIETLCSDQTTIGRVAYLLRESAARITPSVVHDALSILQALPDHSRFSTANMGLEHMHAMISNMMLFPTNEVCFGDAFFGNRGYLESLRPQLERGNGRFRFLVILPFREDGGIELAFSTYPEELEMFQADEEFTKYAEILNPCC